MNTLLTARRFGIVSLLAIAAGCSTAPRTDTGRQALATEAQAAITRISAKDSSLVPFLNDRAYGYVVFPSIGKGGAIVGGAYGKGIVYEHGRPVGYSDITQATIGAQLGGQSYTEIIAFQTASKLNDFKAGNFTFSANASAVAIKAGAAAATDFRDGTAVFTDTEAGLMAEASLGGQRFTYQGQ